MAGEADAFGILLARYQDLYIRFAMRMLGNYEDAEDALQSAFMRAYRGIGACQDPDRFAGWLYRIVVNECRTLGRRRERREQRFVREPVDHLPAVSDDGALHEDIQQALDQLPVEHREAFVLKYVEDMSYEEMSALTGVGISALKMRVKRSCDRLRELLSGLVV